MKTLILTVSFLFMSVSARSQTSIQGSISDEVTGKKLGGATVKIIDLNFGVLTDSNGIFILKELPIRILTIEFAMIGYMPYRTTINCDTLIEPLSIKLTPTEIHTE